MARNKSEAWPILIDSKIWMPTNSEYSSTRWAHGGGSWAFLASEPPNPSSSRDCYSIWLQSSKIDSESYSRRRFITRHAADQIWRMLDEGPMFRDIPKGTCFTHSNGVSALIPPPRFLQHTFPNGKGA